MRAYEGLHAYYGDLHNHCGISYGHGSLHEALANAREQLDFCSVTGHAHWPDMPEPDARIQYIIDFHKEGFAKLKAGWGRVLDTLRAANEEGAFVVFPGFEIHFDATGDRAIVYRDLEGELLYADSLADLNARLRALAEQGRPALALPHHIGYRKGTRGIDWDSFEPEFAPILEIISMHGCSEGSENPRPFLHSMGPSDWESTAQYGLAQGHIFGFSGNTDHHSAHPGSYGHGRTGAWAQGLTREALWEAFFARRTYALTGDRIALRFALNDAPMGALLEAGGGTRRIEVAVEGGGAIDCVDIVKNNRLLRRFSETDVAEEAAGEVVRTKLFLELGWGEKRKQADWDVSFGISAGEILSVEPRFRGQEVVSPVEREDGAPAQLHSAHWEREGERGVRFTASSIGNPTNSTSATQGMCLEVEMPREGTVEAVLNGRAARFPLTRLLAGARTGRLGGIDSPAYRFHRAPLPWEFEWVFSFEDEAEGEDVYYVRVRQKNGQWAWSSPIFFR